VLTQIEELVRQLQPTDDPDELGRIDKIIRDLTLIRKTSLAEMHGPIVGAAYRVTEQRKAKRSYNDAAIFASFHDAGWGLQELIDADAVRMTWRWTELKAAAYSADVEMRIAGHEVESLGEIDAAQVGEVWSSSYKIEGVQE
jgi:hypothetical protein